MGGESATEPLKGEDWAGDMGERWLANLDRFEAMIAPIGNALLTRAAYRAGERVIDVGPGGGATTRAIARTVAPEGEALGIDISPDLVGEAARRAEAEGIANARFLCADAAEVTLGGRPYDRLFSRFGSMFFADPVPAFANLRSLLQPGARIDIAVWGPPRENLWMMEMMGVVRTHVEVPRAEPRAPGPFAFEDLDYLREVLTGAGFGGMDVDVYEGRQAIGGSDASPAEALEMVLSSMGVGRVVDEQDDPTREAIRADLLSLFDQRHVDGEGVLMAAKAWLVTAVA
ncbi:class I SAM-dependent methyltransferase [Erythrobacter sp.]|jgi:SAM-dependent methyltransferase|uniref:class I SAM-dependent methyltransferase n=1 Tax=Erythrobacter sp. TaxID=1042 RepID=UPI002EB63282|nr:class I SAM-dependent methyltransferase [Erythrobacter sp.]